MQLARTLLHLLHAELPETVGRYEPVLLGYLYQRTVVIILQVPPYLFNALLFEPLVGGAMINLAEPLTESRNTHAEHSGKFLYAVRSVTVAVHLHSEDGGKQWLQPFLGKLEVQLGEGRVLSADLFAPFHKEIVTHLVAHIVQGCGVPVRYSTSHR